MYVVRDIFKLKFGHFKPAKELLTEAMDKGLLPAPERKPRALSDFTGDSYRLIFEESYESLAEFENELTGSMQKPEWQQWYTKFKEHIESSSREILKTVN
ncbi:MAG TPA: NIPSNAP family protein [Phnomibacter sp.]|nr:NIPSNAP family protein [Phnomibacter sp.]